MYQNLSNEHYARIMKQIGKKYMPAEEKKKKKLNLKQIFIIKKRYKK